MTQRIFSIPFNSDLELAEEALLSGKVGEVYFAAPPEVNASRTGSSETTTAPQLKKLIALCRRHGAKANLLCNSYTLYHNGLSELFAFIDSVKGIDAVTISDPLALQEFRRRFPKKDLHASVIMSLDSAEKVDYAVGLGLKGVCLPLNSNRDGVTLDRVRDLKKRHPFLTVKLMANQDCRANCVFAPWHYLLIAQSEIPPSVPSQEHERAYSCIGDCRAPCVKPEELLQVPFIRPEDVAYYRKQGWADLFKLVYREYESRLLRKIYGAYFAGSCDGDLFDLVQTAYARREFETIVNAAIPPEFVERVTSCDKNCLACSYCRDVAAKVVRPAPTR